MTAVLRREPPALRFGAKPQSSTTLAAAQTGLRGTLNMVKRTNYSTTKAGWRARLGKPEIRIPKAESRRPKEGRNPKPEGRNEAEFRRWCRRDRSYSELGFRVSFGLRNSGFGFVPNPSRAAWPTAAAVPGIARPA